MTRAVSGLHRINKTASNNTNKDNESFYQHIADPSTAMIMRCMDTALIGSTSMLHAESVTDNISTLSVVGYTSRHLPYIQVTDTPATDSLRLTTHYSSLNNHLPPPRIASRHLSSTSPLSVRSASSFLCSISCVLGKSGFQYPGGDGLLANLCLCLP
jgi:hypothetical protein